MEGIFLPICGAGGFDVRYALGTIGERALACCREFDTSTNQRAPCTVSITPREWLSAGLCCSWLRNCHLNMRPSIYLSKSVPPGELADQVVSQRNSLRLALHKILNTTRAFLQSFSFCFQGVLLSLLSPSNHAVYHTSNTTLSF
jgi:hypothetical protein